MALEIKTATLTPNRNTFANLTRRFGDKSATRYQEATYDAQGTTNFNYRPLWMPDKTLNDLTHTELTMSDWYLFRDPRQFYYGAYVQNRAKMQEGAENQYAFFEKHDLSMHFSDELKQFIATNFLPLRHLEQTSNLNYMSGSAYGYGTAISQASLYAAMDSLGMAQYLSRIGLLLDHNNADLLSLAKEAWMTDAKWQGIRALCEALLIEKDWFELLLIQGLLINTTVTAIFYGALETSIKASGGRDITILTEFMHDCLKDLSLWSDSVFKVAASDSPENKALLEAWIQTWQPRIEAAFTPYLSQTFPETHEEIAQSIRDLIEQRAQKAGLTI